MERKVESLSLEEARRMVRERGYKNSAADWESASHVYAFSVESHGPAAYGHPRLTVHYNKASKYLNVH
jgi:hypothetical protein